MSRASLDDLENKDEFVNRHIGPSDDDVAEMLGIVGLKSLDELIDKAVPDEIRTDEAFDEPAMTEVEALAELSRMAGMNKVMKTMIGLGYHDTITPSVILRNLIENPGWYTAYTPYQAEISQGRLEALLNFQQSIIDLTGMPLANASLLDEGTAAAEAMTLMKRSGKSKSDTIFVADSCLPQTIAVIETRARPLGFTVQTGDPFNDLDPAGVFGVILQYPTVNGEVHDYAALADKIHDAGALLTVACDPLALVMLKAPGEWGADIVVGSAQRFGVPLGFGGPHAAFMATREEYRRSVPGRIIGVSVDAQGRQALRMALQTREQHIRREKATSNICTAQVLLANVASMYCVYHGPDGLKRIAGRVHRLTSILAHGLMGLGIDVANRSWFDTLTLNTPGEAEAIHQRAVSAGYNLRRMGADQVGISLNEATTRDDIMALLAIVSGKPDHGSDLLKLDAAAEDGVPDSLCRESDILTHPVFNAHHSETAMMRYLRALEEKDLALNRAMIPLGSCTMKLNAASEMIPVTWAGFGKIHPFQPLDQVEGYLEMIRDLEAKLCQITGFAAVSLQPNAGSQGEYAGLLTIRAYHHERGDDHRNICLIPSSAHGTNPASAVMANMKVVVVNCDDLGNVDVEDLKSKAEAHAENLAALMVTYPSTHGVFETRIKEICQIVHDNGGQVYMDGANLQAMVGICRPGRFGPDVMHMNLHKTFCIPHGGGGPGVGPIAVGEHLAPFLPGSPVVPESGPEGGIGAVSAAPWGSASILPISWAYIAMMGGQGLKKATQVAILNANYVAARLKDHFKILYSGPGGLVAHECIIDTRPIQNAAHLTVDDIAKRLMDYGFHSPTMSWPVMHTLMMEPTESEPREELDRFCEAMIAIAAEAHKVEAGDWPTDNNPLVHAPHTADVVMSDDWDRPYPREVAAYPVAGLRRDKYWPSVGRIDNAHGDRNLVCTCPSIDEYQEAAE
ncbi:MAG: aminomethyl-transferring glycine dehydrogenase [Rhodospirillales bacterium]